MNPLNWLARPLGIRGIDIGAVKSPALDISVGALALGLLVTILVVGVAVSIASYLRTTEPISSRKRVWFAISRAVVYGLLILSVAGLSLRAGVEVLHKPNCLLLVDNTRSMSVRESGANAPSAGSRGAVGARRHDLVSNLLSKRFLSQLKKRRTVVAQTFDGTALDLSGRPQSGASGQRTDIPSVLEGVLRKEHAADLQEIILITDGRDTVRANYQAALAAIKNRGTRLLPVIAGSPEHLKDVKLTMASTAPYCRAFDLLSVSYSASHTGCSGESVKVEAFEAGAPGKVLAQAELLLNDEPTGQRGNLTLAPPTRSGDVHLAIRISTVPGETVTENNRIDIFTQIVDEPVKVLYVDNFPRAEFKHVKQSLDRDPNIALTLLNRMPGGAWLVQGNALLERPELGFPAEPAELLKYDVLILGTISRGYFSAGDRFEERKLTSIANFVSGRGGGLIVLGGHRSFGHGKYHGSPLEPVLPFEVGKPGEEEYLTKEIRAELVGLARYHPALQLAGTPEENLKVWQELPELQGCNIVGKPRPGAQVLAVSSVAVDGKKPTILACQQYGFGRVLACTTYSTFRWRLGTPVEKGDLLGRFWSQAVRYVSPDPRIVANAMNVQLDKPNHVCGEIAEISLRPLDAFYAPVRKQHLRLKVKRPDQTEIEARLAEEPASKGLYRAELRLDQVGSYEITAAGPKDMKEHITLIAGASSEEYRDVRPDRGQLTALAEASGGKLFTIDQADELLRSLDTKPRTEERNIEAPLWDCPLMLLLILGLCLSEWFFRKRSGLA